MSNNNNSKGPAHGTRSNAPDLTSLPSPQKKSKTSKNSKPPRYQAKNVESFIFSAPRQPLRNAIITHYLLDEDWRVVPPPALVELVTAVDPNLEYIYPPAYCIILSQAHTACRSWSANDTARFHRAVILYSVLARSGYPDQLAGVDAFLTSVPSTATLENEFANDTNRCSGLKTLWWFINHFGLKDFYRGQRERLHPSVLAYIRQALLSDFIIPICDDADCPRFVDYEVPKASVPPILFYNADLEFCLHSIVVAATRDRDTHFLGNNQPWPSLRPHIKYVEAHYGDVPGLMHWVHALIHIARASEARKLAVKLDENATSGLPDLLAGLTLKVANHCASHTSIQDKWKWYDDSRFLVHSWSGAQNDPNHYPSPYVLALMTVPARRERQPFVHPPPRVQLTMPLQQCSHRKSRASQLFVDAEIPIYTFTQKYIDRPPRATFCYNSSLPLPTYSDIEGPSANGPGNVTLAFTNQTYFRAACIARVIEEASSMDEVGMTTIAADQLRSSIIEDAKLNAERSLSLSSSSSSSSSIGFNTPPPVTQRSTNSTVLFPPRASNNHGQLPSFSTSTHSPLPGVLPQPQLATNLSEAQPPVDNHLNQHHDNTSALHQQPFFNISTELPTGPYSASQSFHQGNNGFLN